MGWQGESIPPAGPDAAGRQRRPATEQTKWNDGRLVQHRQRRAPTEWCAGDERLRANGAWRGRVQRHCRHVCWPPRRGVGTRRVQHAETGPCSVRASGDSGHRHRESLSYDAGVAGDREFRGPRPTIDSSHPQKGGPGLVCRVARDGHPGARGATRGLFLADADRD